MSTTDNQLVVFLPAGVPDGTHLLTVVRGPGEKDRSSFNMAVQTPSQGPSGPAGPAGPIGPIGPAGPKGAVGATGPQEGDERWPGRRMIPNEGDGRRSRPGRVTRALSGPRATPGWPDPKAIRDQPDQRAIPEQPDRRETRARRVILAPRDPVDRRATARLDRRWLWVLPDRPVPSGRAGRVRTAREPRDRCTGAQGAGSARSAGSHGSARTAGPARRQRTPDRIYGWPAPLYGVDPSQTDDRECDVPSGQRTSSAGLRFTDTHVGADRGIVVPVRGCQWRVTPKPQRDNAIDLPVPRLRDLRYEINLGARGSSPRALSFSVSELWPPDPRQPPASSRQSPPLSRQT